MELDGGYLRIGTSIAWGGVLAQSILLAVACVVVWLFGSGRSTAAADLSYALVVSNAFMVLLNLLPMHPFDGVEAWRIVPLGLRRSAEHATRSRRRLLGWMEWRRLERREARDDIDELPEDVREQLRTLAATGADVQRNDGKA